MTSAPTPVSTPDSVTLPRITHNETTVQLSIEHFRQNTSESVVHDRSRRQLPDLKAPQRFKTESYIFALTCVQPTLRPRPSKGLDCRAPLRSHSLMRRSLFSVKCVFYNKLLFQVSRYITLLNVASWRTYKRAPSDARHVLRKLDSVIVV
jgi:hypothetical protein